MHGTFWTPEELDVVREMYPTTDSEVIAGILNERFGSGRNANAVSQRAHVLGVHKAPEFRWKKKPVKWTDDRREWFVAFAPGHTEAEISAEHERVFGEPLTEGQIGCAKTRFGVKSGTHGGRFKKGMVPWNKGTKWSETVPKESQERSLRTCFAKGNMPHNARGKDVGCERVDAEGYTWVKVAERPSRPDCNDNWRQKHYLAWEKANGRPVPKGANIVFANHDRADFRPENLVAVPRRVGAVIVRNSLPYCDAASLGACIAAAELKSAIADAELAPRECRVCGREFKPRYKQQRRCDACLGMA